MRKFWVIGVVVVALAVAAVVAYRVIGPAIGPGAAPQQAATTEAPGEPATGTPPAAAEPVPAAETAPAQEAVPAPQGVAVDQPEVTADDHVLGAADAPVTVFEYASLTCPHCAAFHTQTLPQLKSTYIDAGKVRLVYRDYPLDRVALAASLLARCAPDDRYFAMLDVLFRSQDDWAGATDPAAALSQIGRTGGLDQAKIDGCLNDQAETDEIVAGIQAAQNQYKINSTPTLIIDGTSYAGALSFEQMEAVLGALLPK